MATDRLGEIKEEGKCVPSPRRSRTGHMARRKADEGVGNAHGACVMASRGKQLACSAREQSWREKREVEGGRKKI